MVVLNRNEEKYIMKNMLAKAIMMASVAHIDQTDKGGNPYILHTLRVMNSLGGDELKQIGVMHDIVEDTQMTLVGLKSAGFSERVVDGVDCMTKRLGEMNEEYLIRVESNVDSIRVKLADLKDNSDITRLKGIETKDFERMEKYHRSFVRLTKKLNEVKTKIMIDK